MSRFAGEMSRENDGADFNTNRRVFGVLFSLEDVRSVHSKVDDGKRKSFNRRGDDGKDEHERGDDGFGDEFWIEMPVDVRVREHLLELRGVDSFAAEEHSPVARGWGREYEWERRRKRRGRRREWW